MSLYTIDMDESLDTEVKKTPRQAVGPMAGAVIVVALVVLGGLYFFIKEFIIH